MTRLVSAAGLGAGEADRRQLTETQIERIVAAEVAERVSAARQYEGLGHADRAGRLHREVAVLTAVISGQSC